MSPVCSSKSGRSGLTEFARPDRSIITRPDDIHWVTVHGHRTTDVEAFLIVPLIFTFAPVRGTLRSETIEIRPLLSTTRYAPRSARRNRRRRGRTR